MDQYAGQQIVSGETICANMTFFLHFYQEVMLAHFQIGHICHLMCSAVSYVKCGISLNMLHIKVECPCYDEG